MSQRLLIRPEVLGRFWEISIWNIITCLEGLIRLLIGGSYGLDLIALWLVELSRLVTEKLFLRLFLVVGLLLILLLILWILLVLIFGVLLLLLIVILLVLSIELLTLCEERLIILVHVGLHIVLLVLSLKLLLLCHLRVLVCIIIVLLIEVLRHWHLLC